MKFVVRLFPEVMVKSKSVRQRFTRLLETNVRNVLKRVDEQVKVRNLWDRLEVIAPGNGLHKRAALIDALSHIPGIANFSPCDDLPWHSLDDIASQVAAYWAPRIGNRSFCVRVRRMQQCTTSSLDIERYVGGRLNELCPEARVQLKQPDLTVRLDVDKERFALLHEQYPGLGGFPLASQEDVMVLLSGGYDSAVAAWQLIKRGSRVHYCFFNVGGPDHQSGVQRIACHLWKKYGSSHRVKFVAVPFEPVVNAIVEQVDPGQMGVVFKRLMMKVAGRMADRQKIDALVTGEAVGQVASQTLTNLRIIDSATDHIILRPLIAADKQEIIDVAKRIGSASMSEALPEYCSVISRSPTVRAVAARIEAEEAKIDPALLDAAVRNAMTLDIRDLAAAGQESSSEPETVATLPLDAVVIDIRSPEEQEARPLTLAVDVESIPFFQLERRFPTLAADRNYYLYCDRGVMSRLHALLLSERGFANVKVYRP